MAYITTFDAVFFIGVIYFLALEVLSEVFSDEIVDFTVGNFRASLILFLLTTVGPVIGSLYYSVKGTTTLVFWVIIGSLVFIKPLIKYQKRKADEVLEHLSRKK